MIYHTIGFPRSGSSYLHSYCRTHHITNNVNVITLGELFTNTHYISDNNIAYDRARPIDKIDVLAKINFLKKNPKKYSFKIIPSTIPEEHRSIVLEYLNECNLLTINRNPFDMFLSFVYQTKTGWTEVHGGTKPLVNKLDIDLQDIDDFINLWDLNRKFINQCKIYHTFDYEDLDKQLYDFFKVQNLYPGIKKMEPMQIDYKSLVTEFKSVKERFDENLKSRL